jgi:hypothetical protein
LGGEGLNIEVKLLSKVFSMLSRYNPNKEYINEIKRKEYMENNTEE